MKRKNKTLRDRIATEVGRQSALKRQYVESPHSVVNRLSGLTENDGFLKWKGLYEKIRHHLH